MVLRRRKNCIYVCHTLYSEVGRICVRSLICLNKSYKSLNWLFISDFLCGVISSATLNCCSRLWPLKTSVHVTVCSWTFSLKKTFVISKSQVKSCYRLLWLSQQAGLRIMNGFLQKPAALKFPQYLSFWNGAVHRLLQEI